jgi:hypothetical protein
LFSTLSALRGKYASPQDTMERPIRPSPRSAFRVTRQS